MSTKDLKCLLNKMSTQNDKKIIGRLEYVDIPSLGLYQATAKIDTGAYRGSIHVSDVQEIEENGEKKLQFRIVDKRHPELKDKVYKVSNYSVKRFRGTKVASHDRYVIPVSIKMAGEEVNIELSLSNRSGLRYPILIGRRALKGRFLVDVSKRY